MTLFFQILLNETAHFLKDRGIVPEKKLLATLWVLANQESFRGVADRFDLNKGTLHRCAMQVRNYQLAFI